jgi:hypothetical protein
MNTPLFILAPPRSFTSITCGMIGQHPEMLGLPEVNLFMADTYWGLSRLYERFRPRLGHGLLRAISELGLGSQSYESVEMARDWLVQSPQTTTKELFEDLMHWAAPRRLVDKSPAYVYSEESLERIWRAFPDAMYIHLARHPRSHCESVIRITGEIGDREHEARQRGVAPPHGEARFIHPERLNPDNIWLKPHLRIMDFMAKVPERQRLFIRGEDVLATPEKFLPMIAEWLGISTSNEAIDQMKHPELSPFACYGPSNARVGNDPGFLEDSVLRIYSPKALSLEGGMAWDAELVFGEQLKEVASAFGY